MLLMTSKIMDRRWQFSPNICHLWYNSSLPLSNHFQPKSHWTTSFQIRKFKEKQERERSKREKERKRDAAEVLERHRGNKESMRAMSRNLKTTKSADKSVIDIRDAERRASDEGNIREQESLHGWLQPRNTETDYTKLDLHKLKRP